MNTRVKRQGGQEPVYFHITDTTKIANVPLNKLLSHTKTKLEFTTYLAQKIMKQAKETQKRLVVSWRCLCKGTHRNMDYLNGDQEEADTKMILHAIDATKYGATKICICSPDTDVLVLLLRRYPELCEDSVFHTGTGSKQHIIPLRQIVDALGKDKTAALPAFHALTGADVTGSFAGKGKLMGWKVFIDSCDEVIHGMINLGLGHGPSEQTIKAIEKFVCQLYLPNT